MKSYIEQRPPGWAKRPEQPVIIVAGEEEKQVRENLYAFSDFWRKVKRRADQILIRNPRAERVDVCNGKGEAIRTITREVWPEEPWLEKKPDAPRERIGLAGEADKPRAGARKATGTSIPPSSKKRGRPSGKRSDRAFTQITAYVKTATIADVKIRLIKQGSQQDVSELIEELLTVWLKG